MILRRLVRAQAILVAALIAAPAISLAQTAPLTQSQLAEQTPEQLAARAASRAANRNRPGPWWSAVSARPDDWYRTDEGRRITANILSWQDASGGWPLMNTTNEPFTGDLSAAGPWGTKGALIKATVNEMRFLARAHLATGEARDLQAVRRGLRFILRNQYPSGGWPHSVPPPETGYERYATFNDDMMVDLMILLREVAAGGDFQALPAEDRLAAQAAFNAALDFILRSQIVVDGRLTAWGQQHDEVTLEVRPARTFEPAGISGGESAGVLMLLMSIDAPSPEVVRAIEGGVDWYDRSQIRGVSVVLENGDRIVRPDPDAPPLWARLYEVETNRPIFAGRDSVVRYSLAEIEQERRAGYGWYNQAGAAVLARYRGWRGRRAGLPG
ncbi:MAG: pectate lyase [Brevundimonas sp.]|nr:MAG: pectate lyase [Brevundimonas sp.]